MSEDPFDDIEQMLSALFGADVAADAVAALRSSGVDPAQFAKMSGVDLSQISPGQMMAMRAQMQQMMAGAQDGPVNWTMGCSLALQEAA